LCEVGEDTIHVHKNGKLAMNGEIFNEESLAKLGYKAEDFESKKAAEVGNIFTFGTKKCEEMELFFTNKEGKKEAVFLGSYGIGVTRVMGVIAEIFSDEKGLVWPQSVAPFTVHLIQLGNIADKATALYEKLTTQGIEVLFDDRDTGAGAKFADADLIGIPYRVVISDKSLEKGGLEFKKRNDADGKIISENELFDLLQD
jgi:prolyl-tRNA synthetase